MPWIRPLARPIAGAVEAGYPRTGDRAIPGPKDGPGLREGYRQPMTRLILSYPDGRSGIALLLLRLTCALGVFPSIRALWPEQASWWPAEIAAAVPCLALMIGLLARPAALLILAILAASLFAIPGESVLFLTGSAGGLAVLLLLGPGAYSIDARRFGRRVIRLDPRSPDRGGGD